MKPLLLLLITLKFKIHISAEFTDKKSTRFYNLTKQKYFIDKTDFLGEFFLNKQKQLYFITCPHQFGKTIYAEMIKCFAGVEQNGNNFLLQPNETQAYEIFSNLSIGKNKKIMSKHLANHLVLLLDLNLDHEKTWQSFLSSLQSRIKELFLEYIFIYDLFKVDEVFMAKYPILDKVFNSQLEQNETAYSLEVLIQVLNNFYEGRVILLVDHYDTLVNQFSHSPEDINRVYEVINDMIFQALHERNGVQYGLIFGVSSLMFPIPLPYIHNITHFPFLGRHRFTKYFGFTKSDFKSLSKGYNFIPYDAVQMKVLFEYTSLDRIQLYDPLSVTEYLKSGRGENSTKIETIENKYCGRKNQFGLISSFMKSNSFRLIVIMLLRLNQLTLDIVHTYHQSKNVFEIVSNLKSDRLSSIFDVEILLAYFFEHGFLSHEKETNSYSIPNLKVDVELRNELKLFYMESRNMFEILQLTQVLKEILHCPGNATVSKKSTLSRAMHELFESMKQSKEHNFDDIDLFGLIYAFASEMDLWICSEEIARKIGLLKHRTNLVLLDRDVMSKLAPFTFLK